MHTLAHAHSLNSPFRYLSVLLQISSQQSIIRSYVLKMFYLQKLWYSQEHLLLHTKNDFAYAELKWLTSAMCNSQINVVKQAYLVQNAWTWALVLSCRVYPEGQI